MITEEKTSMNQGCSNCEETKYATLPPFSLIRDFGKHNIRGNVSKISVSLVIDMSDRNPPITARYHDVEKVRRSH